MAINEIKAGETMHVQGEASFGARVARDAPHAAIG